MTIAFPTSLDSLTNPAGMDMVSVVDHAGQHSDVNDAVEALEAKVGINSSVVTTSLDYLVKSTSSVSPGHKHAATEIANGTVSNAEFQYLDGVTSAIQTQLDAKGSGTVTAVSVASSNGFAGSSGGGATPILTLTTSITGVLLGNGTAISASNVTNDVQTKAAIVPNTAPSAGQILVGNAGGTAYAPVSASGAFTLASTGAATIATPGTNTVSSTNSTATAHTHAITSSSAPGAAASLLATDSSGIIGSTGTRIVKGWFTDITVTNAIAGSITGTAAVATTATVANEATDTTCFPTFVTAATGDLGPKSNAAFTFNANTVNLGCTTFTGALVGNASTATNVAVGGITGLGTGVGTFLATPSSANLLAAVTDETGSGALVFGTTPTIATPVINGLATGTGVSATATVSTLASRDASGNSGFNNALEGYTTTATAAGTTTLTIASTADQYFTGSTTQTVTLPVASTLVLGFTFTIDNASTGAVTVNSSGGNAVIILAGGTCAMVSCILTSGTGAASWKATYLAANAATGKSLTVSNTLTLAGTDATTMTFPSTSATIARTDAANTFTGVQTMTSPALTTPAITGLATGSGVASAATVSTLASRDANGNSSFVNLIEGFTTTATAAGTTTLTVASTYSQIFTGSTTQTVKLPTTSIVAGQQYVITNNSTGLVTVQSSGANTIVILGASTSAIFTAVVVTPTTAANWNFAYAGVNAASGKVATINNTITLAGTDATTMTFPSTSATIARTDAANTFTGVQTMTSPVFTTPTLGVASATSLATSAATPLLLTNGQLVNVALTSQTTGATTLTIPDFASVADEFTFKTKSQTMSNKTFVAPALGTPASGVLTNCSGTAASLTAGNANGSGSWSFSYRNSLINGDMSLSRRATSFTGIVGTVVQTLDSWCALSAAGASMSVSQQSGIALNGFNYAMRWGRPNANTNTSVNYVYQIIKTADVYPLQGQSCILSFYARAGANFSAASSQITVNVQSGTGVDQGSASFAASTWTTQGSIISTAQAITTTLTRYSFTVAVGATHKELGILFYFTPVGTAGAADYVEITGVQLEVGVATPYEFLPDSVNLSRACEFLQMSFPRGTAPAQSAGVGGAITVKNPIALGDPSEYVQFIPPMFKTPTITTYNPSAANANWRDITAAADSTVSVDPGTTIGTSGVLIATSGTVTTLGDILAIHYKADAAI